MIDFSLGNLKIRVIFLVYARASYPLHQLQLKINQILVIYKLCNIQLKVEAG